MSQLQPSLLLLRGIPGSGKSSMARQLVQRGEMDIHLESDTWLYNHDGVYEWSPERVVVAHARCLEETRAELRKGQRVVVANVFIVQAHIEPYRQLAEELAMELGQTIPFRVEVIQGPWKNVHDVPEDVLELMRGRWEP